VLGYSPWLKKSKLTARMTVTLLFYTLSNLYYFAAGRPTHRADLRAHMIELLQQRRIRPTGLTDEEQQLGRALVHLEEIVTANHGPLFTYDPKTDSLRPEREAKNIAQAWAAIQERWPAETRSLAAQVARLHGSEETLKLGHRPGDPVIHLGEQADYAAKAEQLRGELGDKFLSPTATASYRAACARKWKQHALARAARDQELERAQREHNKRARDAHENDSGTPPKPYAFLIV
jgi:hypothetical protein